ncbi:MAG: TlpA family protein disulfide reductase [Algicola sp.]|nr:TlpA family protein disulfide reductase [Algicola sp.]
MKKMFAVMLLAGFILCCKTQPNPTTFSADALSDTFINTEGASITLQSILEANQGKTVLIDVWASWCRDCIEGMPDIKSMQDEYSDVAFVFMSMDKSQKSWKNGIQKYELNGQHYFMPDGWKSAFSEFLDLDWIPRYLVVDGDGNISLFKAIKITDPLIKVHLDKNK